MPGLPAPVSEASQTTADVHVAIDALALRLGLGSLDDVMREYRHGHLTGSPELEQLRGLVEEIT